MYSPEVEAVVAVDVCSSTLVMLSMSSESSSSVIRCNVDRLCMEFASKYDDRLCSELEGCRSLDRSQGPISWYSGSDSRDRLDSGEEFGSDS